MLRTLALVMAFALPSAAFAQEDGWLTNAEQGFEKARKENKPLVVDFRHPW